MSNCRRSPHDDQSAIREAREIGDGVLHLAGIAPVDWGHLHVYERSHGLDRAQLPASGGNAWVANDRDAGHARRNLLEQIKPFSAHAIVYAGEASHIAARPCQTPYESAADRISD